MNRRSIEDRAVLPADSTPLAPRKSTARDRVSNGSDVLPSVDGRSQIARRYRDIASAILVDNGGLDHCSESRVQLIRRFAACSVLAEQLEARLARGEPIDIAEHASLASTLVRLANRIGIERRARPVETLAEYISSRYGTGQPAAIAGESECESASEAADAETRADDLPNAAAEVS